MVLVVLHRFRPSNMCWRATRQADGDISGTGPKEEILRWTLFVIAPSRTLACFKIKRAGCDRGLREGR